MINYRAFCTEHFTKPFLYTNIKDNLLSLILEKSCMSPLYDVLSACSLCGSFPETDLIIDVYKMSINIKYAALKYHAIIASLWI